MNITEHELQVLCVQWFDLQHKQFEGRLFAIPNGGKRNIITAKKLKAEGVKSGVPDLFLPVASGVYHGLFIEMKKPKTEKSAAGRLTENQKDWLQYLEGANYFCAVVSSFKDFKYFVNNYLLQR